MKKIITLIFYLCFCNYNYAQLNCKKNTDIDGNKTMSCYHTNGKLSSIETWDKNNRNGSIKCYTSLGKEIINYDLRKFAGHASIYLDYYENGQIKKAEYRSAPDGGIQFYHTIYRFSETGICTDYQDLSEPDGHPKLLLEFDRKKQLENVLKPEVKKQEVITCAVPYITSFEVINKTKNKVAVLLKAQNNLMIQLRDTTLVIRARKAVIANSIMLAQTFLKQEESYKIEIVGSAKNKVKYKIIMEQPEETNQTKTYRWYIFKM